MQKHKYMRITNGVVIAGLLSGMLGGVTGCTTYVEAPRPPQVYNPPPQVGAQPPPAYVPQPPIETPPLYAPPPVQVTYVIREESDFYEPLSRYGQWVTVAPYGRCWIPAHVDPDWRPYTNGHWERTDAGWYWASDEAWGWATYHYGRWDWNPEMGWLWVPQTLWAPAWVSFHQGGGYTGWAPLHPSARFENDRPEHMRDEPTAPRAYVFVEDRHFLEPVRPTTVVVNNTTIINKTVNITNIKVVNNTVINEGPRTTVIEQASGRKVQTVPVHELRRKQEAAVVATRAAAPVTVPGTIPPGHQRGKQAQLEQERVVNEAKARAQEEAQRIAKEQQIKAAQLESARLANEAKLKAQAEAQRNAREQEMKAAQLEAQRRSSEAKAGVQEVAQRPVPRRVEDPSVSARVSKMLAADPEFKRVNVVFSRNIIQLNGFVSSAEQKNRAGALARKVEGVRGVQNNITIKD
jgi:osmotically-inducible protein OsmY